MGTLWRFWGHMPGPYSITSEAKIPVEDFPFRPAGRMFKADFHRHQHSIQHVRISSTRKAQQNPGDYHKPTKGDECIKIFIVG